MECFLERPGLQRCTKAASRCVQSSDHQIYVSGETMEDAETGL